MKSRFAVSVVFCLVAAMFLPDAAVAFERLRSWTGEVWVHCRSKGWHRVTGLGSGRMTAINSGVTMIEVGGLRFRQNFANKNHPGLVGTHSPGSRNLSSNYLDRLVPMQQLQDLIKFTGERFEMTIMAGKQAVEVFNLLRTK